MRNAKNPVNCNFRLADLDEGYKRSDEREYNLSVDQTVQCFAISSRNRFESLFDDTSQSSAGFTQYVITERVVSSNKEEKEESENDFHMEPEILPPLNK